MQLSIFLILSFLLVVTAASADTSGAANESGTGVDAQDDQAFTDDGGQTAQAVQPIQQAQTRPEPRFNIWQYDVAGVSLLPAAKIEETLSAFLGPNRSYADIEAAKDKLQQLYVDSGYAAVDVYIPEQDVVNGVVQLAVTEGKIARVWVKDSDYFLPSDIKKRLPSVSTGQVLYGPAVRDEINTLNSLTADLRVIPVVKQGRRPGTLDIDLKIKDDLPLHGAVEYNDHNSANTTDTRLSASVSYDNLWQKYHSFSLQAQTTPEDTDEIQVFVGTYVLPVGGKSDRLAFYLVNSDNRSSITTDGQSDSDTGEAPVVNVAVGGSSLLVTGDSRIFGARYVKPLNSSANFQQVLTLGLDAKDVLETVSFPDDPDAPANLQTPVNYGVWSAQYNATLRGEKALTRFGIGSFYGIRGLGNDLDEFEDKRFKGEPNFFYIKANFRRIDKLFAGLSLVSRLNLQLTEEPLISNEQFSSGGVLSVRGYFESQSLGDKGQSAGLELHSPRFFKGSAKISNFRVFTFFEGAEVSIVDPLPDQQDRFLLSSYGIGLRFSAFSGLNIELDWANPLKSTCSDSCNPSADVERDDSRTNFRLEYRF